MLTQDFLVYLIKINLFFIKVLISFHKISCIEKTLVIAKILIRKLSNDHEFEQLQDLYSRFVIFIYIKLKAC